MHLQKPHLWASLAYFTIAKSLTLPEFPPGNGSLEARTNLVKRGLCTPTGAGVCNFGVENNEPPLGDIERYVYIFNNKCEEIGYTANPPSLPYNLYSQLPYTVVIYALDASSSPHIAFRYGADDLDSDRGGCSCSDCSGGLDACVECQCAFDCRGGCSDACGIGVCVAGSVSLLSGVFARAFAVSDELAGRIDDNFC